MSVVHPSTVLCVCDLRDACCLDDRCSMVVAEVQDDIARNRTHIFLKVLEARKLETDPGELELIQQLEDYLRDALDPDAVPTDTHTPGCFEQRACDGEDD